MRNRFTLTAAALCALTLFASVAEAQDHVGEISVLFSKPSPELVLSTDALAGSSVSEVDFVQEFGIEDEWFPAFRLALGRSHKFRLSYVKFSYEADATIQRTFTFQGRTFTVGAPASTDIEWDLWTVGYEWDFVSRDAGFVGVIADLKYNKVKASVDSPLLTSTAATDTTAPVPTIGLAWRANPSPVFAIGGEFAGFKLDRDDFNVKFTDFDIYGMVNVHRNVGAQVGYRSVVADYVVDEDSGDLKMQGPYIAGVLRF